MIFERKITLVKLKGFLTGEISKTEIYEWALFVAVSRDYEELIKSDPLAEQIIQFLVEINNERARSLPTQKVLGYYVDCLEGSKSFSPDDLRVIMGGKPLVKPAAAPAEKAKPVEKKTLAREKALAAAMKAYVFIFAAVSVLLNLLSIVKPDFLVKHGQIPPTFTEAWRDAFPHLVYGLGMVLALTTKVPRLVFYGLFFIATWGIFFYWYVATDLVLKQGQSLVNLFPLLPFIALPPTAGFLIMLNQWFAQPDEKAAVPGPQVKNAQAGP